MTKATPAASLRSSSRIASNKTNQTNVNIVNKPTNRKTLIKNMKRKVAFEVNKRNVVKIHDFKRQSGQTLYLIEREGPSDTVWETEDMIESDDILSTYQQKVLEESGYSIDEQNNVTEQNQLEQENSRQKFARTSKTRAVMAMKQSDFIDEDISENSNRGTKRKSIIVNGNTKKPGSKRMTKAEQLLQTQREERLERKRDRENLNLESISCSMNHLNIADCCLQCGANAYRTALEKNDMVALKQALKNKELPRYTCEDKPNGLGFVEYAIVLQREKFADKLLKFYKDKEVGTEPTIPNKYCNYDGGNTGRNNRVGEYSRRNFRQVEESRGNRVGNSIFYRGNSLTPRKTYMNVEDQMRYSAMRPFMPYISTPVFKNAHVIENYSTHFENGSHEVYFAVASGSRLFAKNLLQHAKSLGRSTFNHLHEEVLTFENDEPLTSYRKPQILKMASDAFNASPYHFSAINPSAKYLTEFFEALDPAERLETDALGRSVAFYAAVSETSACLEFIESKGINLSLVDKYKMSPLLQAARYGRSHNVELLIKHLRGGSEVTEVSPVVFQTLNRNRRTALHYAAFFGHAETCRVLIKYGAPTECIESLDKQTPLIFAAKNGYVDCIRVLIEEGKANPERGDKFSRTSLHYACINGHMEVVKYLLSQGVNSNAVDSSNNTPAHFASAFGYLTILHILIEYGSADPSVCNVWRSTPCSVANMKGHIAIVKYLLNLSNTSIDVNFKDQEGCIMLQNNINESVSTPFEKKITLEKINLLLAMNANVNSIDLEGNTSLHTLVANDSFTKLTPKNWNTVYPVNNPNQAMYKPTTEDMMDGIEYQLSVAKLLVQHGANLDAKNSDNETPLALAIRRNNSYLVAYLVEAGSKFWIDVDMDGQSIFHYIGKLASCVCQIQCHNEDLSTLRKRQLEALKKVWGAVDKLSSLHMNEIRKLINTPNNDGIAPLIFSVKEAISDQKKTVTREKKMILAAVGVPPPFNLYRSHNSDVYVGPKFQEILKPMKVDLTFNFKIWIQYMNKMVKKFQPDMNQHIELPKDFKKKKPKAKKTDYPAYTGYTALHFAAETQCTDLIDFLLDNGSSPNEIVKLGNEILSGDTPILIAYHHKKDLFQELPSQTMEHTEAAKKIFEITKPDFKEMLNNTVKTLIKYGGCPYLANSKETSTVIKASACADVTNLAIMCSAKPSPGTNVNIQNDQGETALMTAIMFLKTEIQSDKKDIDVAGIHYLLKAKADPNVQFEDGDTILMRAIKTSYVPLLVTILTDAIMPIDHNIQNRKHETALMIACKLNKADIISTYTQHLKQYGEGCELNIFDIYMGTPLSYASSNGNIDAVRELLLLGANPNFYKPQNIPLINAINSQNIEVVSLILNHGAQINIHSDFNGNTPLHTAIITEKHKIVKLLLENGADFNLQNYRRQTPMHLAIEVTKEQTNRSFRIEQLLIKAGADMNVTDFFGRTPLHYVFVESKLIPITRNTSVIAKKVKQISDEMKIEQERVTALHQYDEKFDLNKLAGKSNEEENYVSSWIKEAKKIQLDRAEKEKRKNKFKQHNENEKITILEEEKESLKIYSKYNWETETLIPARFDPIDILRYLSGIKGLQYDIKDDFGRTPLHYAACVGAFSCTSLLIGKNVDINALDSDNNGPVQLALRNNYVDYSVMLCNFGAVVNNDVVLKDGIAKSTFGFSLSKSLINMAYLIMDKGVTLIESIKDALKNGKFHMAEILMQSASDEALSQILPTKGQNMWHIISDFKPFNNEIWEEYIEDIVERLLTLNLSMSQDNFGRTPIHYAAKHSQTVLLRRYLSMSNNAVNFADKDDKSELYYAVESCNVDNVKELLNIVAIREQKITNLKEESLVLKSVKANQLQITELLLEHGFSYDEDSSYGRINAVMVACQNNNEAILQILIKHGANLNKPSHVERKDKFGNDYTVLLHPIFAASVSGHDILEIMLKAGANPNVCGPSSKPEYGRSCFMYNVVLNNIENQKTLLNFNIDLNTVDSNSSRTTFYQFFFTKKNSIKFKNMTNENDRKLIFHDVIYEKMIQKFNPQVKFVDNITGMTPLELAIHERNTVVAERLIQLGADPNILSGVETNEFVASGILNSNNIKLPAFIHAAIENNLELLRVVCSNPDIINWSWYDQDNRNIISYIIGNDVGFSHENVNILKFIAESMKLNEFKKLIRMLDTNGKTPVQYAFERENKSLYDAIVKIDPTSAIKHHVTEDIVYEEDSIMDIDYITTQKVDEDASLEREILQREKDLEKAKNGIKEKDEDEIPKVDHYSNLQKVGSIMLDENDKAYDIMLIKVEVRGWDIYTDTSFYKISIIINKVLNLYILWTRWGSYGDEGQHQKTPYLTLEEAVAEFKSIFKSKTGNNWEERLTNFQQKQGRYELLKTFKHPRDTIIKNFNFLDSKLPLKLSSEVANLMKLICSYKYLSKVYSDSCVDMPLGQIPQKTLDRAQQILKDVTELSKKRKEASSHYSDRSKIQETKTLDFKIAQQCVEYARLLPRNDEFNKPIRSLYDHNGQNIKAEYARMADLSYVGFAANVLLAAKHHINEINPLEYAYHTLNCSIRTITPETETAEYQLVKNYLQSTSHGNQEMVHLMAINRAEEEKRFRPFEKEANRQLLWHGSRIGNFMGILKQGLRISPRTTTTNGAMLGNGVYFADTFAKSLNYATDYYGDQNSMYKIMLLCEVALGSKTAVYGPNNYYRQNQENDLHSMKGQGRSIPDPRNAVYDANGILIPMGPCINYTPHTNEANNSPLTTVGLFGYNNNNNSTLLNYNEYAVYDEDRVKIRYILIIRESSTCFLCSKSNKASLKPLIIHNVKDHNYSRFNDFEAELTKAYITHSKKTPQDIFDQELGAYIDSGLYKKQWNIPLDLNKDSKVCQDCAHHVTSILLEKIMTDSETDIPDLLKKKPACKYGKECRSQSKIAHAKKYQHWFKPNVSDDPTTFEHSNEEVTSSIEEYEEDSEEDEDSEDEDSMDTDEE